MKRAGVASCLPAFILLAGSRPLPAQEGVSLEASIGAEFKVNTYTTSYQRFPSVAAHSSGSFVVVWASYSHVGGTDFDIFGQRYSSSGAKAGVEFRVNTFTTDQQFDPSVSSDSSGNFVVVWQSKTPDGHDYGIFGQRFASSGAPAGGEFQVNTYTTNAQLDPTVASSPSGSFVVVWVSGIGQDGSIWGIFGQRYASSGAKAGAEFLVNTYTTNLQLGPHVASDASGNFIVVWDSGLGQDGASWGVFGQRYSSSGAAAGAEFRINTYTTDAQVVPRAAYDPFGNFVVVWYSYTQDGSGYGVFGRRFSSSGAPAGAEFRVSTYTTDRQDTPSVACDPSGNFVVVWRSTSQSGDDGDGVFGQRYASSGAPAGAEFGVNTYTTDAQDRPSVASGASGTFVVVWGSRTQDGSMDGIFGQRFCSAAPSVTPPSPLTTTQTLCM